MRIDHAALRWFWRAPNLGDAGPAHFSKGVDAGEADAMATEVVDTPAAVGHGDVAEA